MSQKKSQLAAVEHAYTKETQHGAQMAYDGGDSDFWKAVDAYLDAAEKDRKALISPRQIKKP